MIKKETDMKWWSSYVMDLLARGRAGRVSAITRVKLVADYGWVASAEGLLPVLVNTVKA